MTKYLLALSVIAGLSACTGHNPSSNNPNNGGNAVDGDVAISVEKYTIGSGIQASNQELQMDGKIDFGQITLNTVVGAPEKKIVFKNNTGSSVHLQVGQIVAPFQVKVNRCTAELAVNANCYIIVRAIPRDRFKNTVLDSDLLITTSESGNAPIHVVLTAIGGVTNAVNLTGDWEASIAMKTHDDGARDSFRYDFLTYAFPERPKFKTAIVTNTSYNKIPAGALKVKLYGTLIMRSNNCDKDLYPAEQCSVSVILSSDWRNRAELEGGIIAINSKENTNDQKAVETALGLASAVPEITGEYVDPGSGSLWASLSPNSIRVINDKLVMNCTTGVFMSTITNVPVSDSDICTYDPVTKNLVKLDTVSGVTSISGYPRTLFVPTSSYVFNNKYYFYSNGPDLDYELGMSSDPQGNELRVFDPAASSTSLVEEVDPGIDSNTSVAIGASLDPATTTFSNGEKIGEGKFVSFGKINDQSSQVSLLLLDLNKASNRLTVLKDLFTEYGYLTAVTSNGKAYFLLKDADGVNDLWETDGTPAGTKISIDFTTSGFSPVQLTLSGGYDLIMLEINWAGGESRLFHAYADPNGGALNQVDHGYPMQAHGMDSIFSSNQGVVVVAAYSNTTNERNLYRWDGSGSSYSNVFDNLGEVASYGTVVPGYPSGYLQFVGFRGRAGIYGIIFDVQMPLYNMITGQFGYKVYTIAYNTDSQKFAVMSPDFAGKLVSNYGLFGMPLSYYGIVSNIQNPQVIGNEAYYGMGVPFVGAVPGMESPIMGLGKLNLNW